MGLYAQRRELSITKFPGGSEFSAIAWQLGWSVGQEKARFQRLNDCDAYA
jgi:hypothetical protein